MDIPMMPSPDGLPKDDGQRKTEQSHPATYMHDADRQGLQRMELKERTEVPATAEAAHATGSKPVDLDRRPDPTDRGLVAGGNFDATDSESLRHQRDPGPPPEDGNP